MSSAVVAVAWKSAHHRSNGGRQCAISIGHERSSRRTLRRPNVGFTLLELLVVVVIIGLLAGLVAPRYFDQVGKTNTKIAKAQIDSLEKALDQYRLDVGSYPTSEQGLQALNGIAGYLYVVPTIMLTRWTMPFSSVM